MNKITVCIASGFIASQAFGHVPYLERQDLSLEAPFVVVEPEHSIAVYGWLQSTNDVDVFELNITNDTDLFAGILVPVVPAYADFTPSFAIVGPGLPAPAQAIPIKLAPGQGAIVLNDDSSPDREVEFEPFGGKFYYVGPEFDELITATGKWQIVVWDPGHRKGDYVLAIGSEETFSNADLVRSLVNTKIIRQNGELHVPAVNMRPRKK